MSDDPIPDEALCPPPHPAPRATLTARPLVVFEQRAGHPVEVPGGRPFEPAADHGVEAAGRIALASSDHGMVSTSPIAQLQTVTEGEDAPTNNRRRRTAGDVAFTPADRRAAAAGAVVPPR